MDDTPLEKRRTGDRFKTGFAREARAPKRRPRVAGAGHLGAVAGRGALRPLAFTVGVVLATAYPRGVAGADQTASSGSRILVMPIRWTGSPGDLPAKAIDDVILTVVRESARVAAVGQSDIDAALEVERYKDVLGSDNVTALSSVAKMLDADWVLHVRVARVSNSWLASAKLVSMKPLHVVGRRSAFIQSAGQGVADHLAALVGTLFAPDDQVIGVARLSDRTVNQCPQGDLVRCRTECSRGHAGSCLSVAEMYREGIGVAPDRKQAARYLERACTGKHGPSCTELGSLTLEDETSSDGIAKGVRYLSTGCDLHDQWACLQLGEAYEKGTWRVRPDAQEAAEYYSRGCDLGNDIACATVAAMYLEGADLPKNPDRAAQLSAKLCDDKRSTMWPLGCTLLGQSHVLGDGVARDDLRAVALFKLACDADFGGGCWALGSMFANGLGVSRDVASAAKLYAVACKAGFSSACADAGKLQRDGMPGVSDPDADRARDFFARGCRLGDESSCSEADALGGRELAQGLGDKRPTLEAEPLATISRCQDARECREQCDSNDRAACAYLGYRYSVGQGVLRDLRAAGSYYKKACDVGERMSCGNLGVLYERGEGVPRDETVAAALYRRACDLKYPTGCVNLGTLLASGSGLEQDAKAAAAYFRKACDGGVAAGCTNLGLLAESGTGIPRDPDLAIGLYAKSCEAGYGQACGRLGWLYAQGAVVPKNLPRAIDIFAGLCNDGDEMGCERLGAARAESGTHHASANAGRHGSRSGFGIGHLELESPFTDGQFVRELKQ